MSLDTYSNLKTSIANHLDRDDLSDYIDDFIDLAEEMHRGPVDEGGVRCLEQISRESFTVDARQKDFPTGYLEPINFRLLTTPVTDLTHVNYHELNRHRSETTGKPEYYTIGGEFEFNKSPDSSYSGEIIFFKEETALSDSNTTNNILTNYPSLYLYGALVATAPFLMDDPRIVIWQTLYQAGANRANGKSKKARRAKHLVSQPAGATP